MKNTALEQDSLKNSSHNSLSEKVKNIILYARAGRILSTKRYLFYLQLVLTFFLSLVLLGLVDIVSYWFSQLGMEILKSGKINSKEFIWWLKLYYLDLPGRFPSSQELIFYSIFLFIAILFQTFVSYAMPIKIFLSFFLFIFGTSLVYFYLFPAYFPYTLSVISYLYILIEMIILSIIPLILGFSTGFLLFSFRNFFFNFIFIFLVILYGIIFGFVRYVAFLYILSKFSFIWTANLFFNFGPLLDSIYLSGFYGLYLSILSKFYRKKINIWRWTF